MHNFNEGLINYELRWFKKDFEKYRYNHLPKLESLESILGKKILVWYEQGMGDTIQFSRYIQSLIILGANVTFEVQKPLLKFLKDSLVAKLLMMHLIKNLISNAH